MEYNHVNMMIDYYATFPERWEKEYADQKKNKTEMTSVKMARYLNDKNLDNCKILDAGCGTGFFGATLNKKSNEVIGIDSSTAMISYARNRNYDKIIVSDVIKYFKNCKMIYDVVVASDVMMIYPNYGNEPIFWGANKILKQRGLFIFNANLGDDKPKEQNDEKVNLLKYRSHKYGFSIIDEITGYAYIDDITEARVMTHIFVTEKI